MSLRRMPENFKWEAQPQVMEEWYGMTDAIPQVEPKRVSAVFMTEEKSLVIMNKFNEHKIVLIVGRDHWRPIV